MTECVRHYTFELSKGLSAHVHLIRAYMCVCESESESEYCVYIFLYSIRSRIIGSEWHGHFIIISHCVGPTKGASRVVNTLVLAEVQSRSMNTQ